MATKTTSYIEVTDGDLCKVYQLHTTFPDGHRVARPLKMGELAELADTVPMVDHTRHIAARYG